MMVVKSTTGAELAKTYEAICRPEFVGLLGVSVYGFSDGSLPGDLGDTSEALNTGEGVGMLCGLFVSMLQVCSSAHGVRACAGCIQRASCLAMLAHMMKHQLTKGSTLILDWEGLCTIMPTQDLRDLIDQWLLSSGAAAQQRLRCSWLPNTLLHRLEGAMVSTRMTTGRAPTGFSRTGDAKFGPSTDKQRALMLPLAVQLLRMVSCCGGCTEDFMQRSGVLLRCVHLLRHILAACPTTLPVRTAASWALQPLCGRFVWCWPDPCGMGNSLGTPAIHVSNLMGQWRAVCAVCPRPLGAPTSC